MKLEEATRQFQDVLEMRRTWLAEFEDVISMHDEREDIDVQVDTAYEQMRQAWVDEQVERAKARSR